MIKGQTHEILYDIKDKQSVVCWDFDVLKQDIIFNFYHLNSNLQNVVNSNTNKDELKMEKSHSKDNLNNNLVKKHSSKENMNTTDSTNADKKKTSSQDSINEDQLIANCEKQLQNRLSGDASCGLIIPKSWQLNKDFLQIEPELTCREGDSIQVSSIIQASYLKLKIIRRILIILFSPFKGLSHHIETW